jgi:hypothetical protein
MSLIEDAGNTPFEKLSPEAEISPAACPATTRTRAACAGLETETKKRRVRTHPYAVRRAGDPRDTARHAHQVPERPRHRQ